MTAVPEHAYWHEEVPALRLWLPRQRLTKKPIGMCSGKPDHPNNQHNNQYPGSNSMQPHRSDFNPSDDWLQYWRNTQFLGNVPPNEPALPIVTNPMAMGRAPPTTAGGFLPPAAPQTLTSSRMATLSRPTLLEGVELGLRQQAIHDLYQKQRILDVQRLMQQHDYLMNWNPIVRSTHPNIPAAGSLDGIGQLHLPPMERQLLSPFPRSDAANHNPRRLSQIVDLLGQVTANNREGASDDVDFFSLKPDSALRLDPRENRSGADDDFRDRRTPIADGPSPTRNEEKRDSKPAAKDLLRVSCSSGSSLPPAEKAFPSERRNLGDLTAKSHSPSQTQHVLKVLGSTLRCKADPFVDATVLPVRTTSDGLASPGSSNKKNAAASGLPASFPEVLHELLESSDREDLDDIVSWLPHRRAFRVNNKDRFMQEILPRYFKGQNRWSSFLRQLNLYGFARVAKGPDYGAYYHELFVGGRPDLTQYMRRVGTPKGLDRRTFKLAEGDDPNFYNMPPARTPSSAAVPPKSG